MKVILASGNPHKAEELNELFDQAIIHVEAAPQKLEVVEDGESYHANALLKAKAYYDRFKQPVVADDSGLNIAKIPDQLGIHSARFGGDGIDYGARNQLLLDLMKDIPKGEREAYFSCVLCFYLSPEEIYFFEGRVEGEIGFAPKGEHGFGYDPVFYPSKAPNGESLAQLPQWKQENSHRARAAQAAISFFKEQGKTI